MFKAGKFKLMTVIIVLILSACAVNTTAAAPDKISVRLKWLHGVQFAGLYIAEQKGYFEEEKLIVTLEEGGLDYDESALVASGQNDIGIIGAPQLLVARSNNLPIMAVSTIFKIDPFVFFSLKDSNITHPEDFIDKRVMVHPHDVLLPALLNGAGIDMNQIHGVPPNTNLENFYNGEIEVWAGYITNQATRARLDGYEINIIYPSDYNLQFYGDCFIASDEFVQNNPDLVARFLRAALRGWRYAIENPDEAVSVTKQYAETDDDEFFLASMEAQVPLIHTGKEPIGWMNAEDWQNLYNFQRAEMNFESIFKVEEAYTLHFLETLYGGIE